MAQVTLPLADALRTTQACSKSRNVNEDWEQRKLLSHEDLVGASMMLGSFIRLDVLACISTGSKALLPLNHVELLESDIINMREICGCENWVLIGLFRIVDLDSWKKDLQDKRRLSITKLVKRGQQIEEWIVANLSRLQEQDTVKQREPDLVGQKSDSSLFCKTITEIFALSTLTYLHVVISGPNPWLPEISDSVSKTIDAFSSLPDAGLLRHLVWPFCVTACLATEEHWSFFKEKMSNVGSSDRGFNWRSVTTIIEECWKRQGGSETWDWISTMNALGMHMLLL